MIVIIHLESPPGNVMNWLKVLGVQFSCAFGRVPKWQSHLDCISIVVVAVVVDDDDGGGGGGGGDLTESHSCRVTEIALSLFVVDYNDT